MLEYRSKFDIEFVWVVFKLVEFNIYINRELIVLYFDLVMVMFVVINFISGMGGVFLNFFFIFFIVIFMFFEVDSILCWLYIVFVDLGMKLKYIDRFICFVNSYLVIKIVVSLGIGLIIGIWLYVMGVDYFMFWVVLVFMFNFIFNIGLIIVVVFVVLIVFV